MRAKLCGQVLLASLMQAFFKGNEKALHPAQEFPRVRVDPAAYYKSMFGIVSGDTSG